MHSSQLTLLFLLLMTVLCIFKAVPLFNSPDNNLQIKGNRDMLFPIILSLLLVWWFGHRRLFLGGYVDTANYAREYINMSPGIDVKPFQGEWIWSLIMQTCVTYGVPVQIFFTIIEAGYILPLLPVVKKFMPSDPYLGLLFIFSSLFFLPFGVNGIRNGLACHLLLWGIAYIYEGGYTKAFILSFVAFGIHKSTMLPIVTTLFTVFFFRDVKTCVQLWLFSIVLSMFAGGWFTEFFASLGFDDRMSQYSQQIDTDAFSRTGFRWDFLIYSAIPVYFAWYVCVKERISDNWYNAICCTYLLCNAFWVLVIRSSYSNRFAYLSWFIYPLVIAYPLVILPVWHNQDNRTGLILMAYIGFTFIMNFFWHAI